jgi:hypothetical protein
MKSKHRTIGAAVCTAAGGALLILVPAIPISAGTTPDPDTVYCEAAGFQPECRHPRPGRPEPRCGVPASADPEPATATSTSATKDDSALDDQPLTGNKLGVPVPYHLQELENMGRRAQRDSSGTNDAAELDVIDELVVGATPW